MMTEQMAPPSTDEFVGRLFDSGLKALELATIYIGDRLGLYQTLADSGALTPSELAQATGLTERYVREWLEQQAVASILTVDDATLPEHKRRYALPPEYAEALIKPESPFSASPIARTAVVLALAAPNVVEAFRTGAGVPWESYGQEGVDLQGDFNRPWLLAQLGSEFLPSLPKVHARLVGDPPARVLDVACGVGWAAIAIANGYPRVTVDAFDIDRTSVERAREHARNAGLEGRVRFEARDAAALDGADTYDFAIIVEAVHDMSNPVGVLSAVRKALKPGASLVVVDERVADSFTAPGDEIERFMYSVSVLLCLPAGMSETPSAATGTVMRASTLERYAREAGFTEFEVLDIEHPMLRFYRLA